ncbi:MAG: VanZ family protein [Chloroflexota bacterium]|jgi:VanZ family protein
MNLQKLLKPIFRWLPAFLVMLAIFLFSSTPSIYLPDLNILDQIIKKGGHMTGYALLAGAYYYGFAKPGKKQFIISLSLSIIYALTDEYHQSYTPGRNPSFIDVGIDTIGASIGLLIYEWFILRKFYSPNSNSRDVPSSQS